MIKPLFSHLLTAGFSIGLMAADPLPNVPERRLFFDRPSAGDRPGEVQQFPEGIAVPPAPVLSPSDALKSFRLQPGYRIELVASEPLVNDPVALDFDPDGRIWVVEMRGYMNDVEGSNRLEPLGRVVVLEDDDGDGRMDRSTVYLDNLVLPRAVKVLSGGVLVAEPPYVWLTRDLDGDLRADQKLPVVEDYGLREGNPSRGPNGLVWGLDNGLHSPMYDGVLRRVSGAWHKQVVPVLGDWGLGMDDYGRFYLNTSSGPLRASLVARHYHLRNPHHSGNGGVYEVITTPEEREVWPIRPNTGVNRGYVPGGLRPDGTLVRYTACGGMCIYRGDRLPAELRGNHFISEPAANLVRRSVVTEEEDGRLSAANAYDQAEFLASTDERFRPVNTYTAPDGTLYVVDMYRGLFESHTFVTTYLKRQVYERDLDRPVGLGRIYRIRHESMASGPVPRLSELTTEDLVQCLTHANGWWRDTAQRLLAERGERAAVPSLRKLARTAAWDVTRIHALATLEGLAALQPADLIESLSDPHPKVRAFAVRLAEPWLRSDGSDPLAEAVARLIHDPAPAVRLQTALSLGERPAAGRVSELQPGLTADAADPWMVDAVLSGLAGLEMEMLDSLAADPEWQELKPGFDRALAALAAAIFTQGDAVRVRRLLQWTASPARRAWQQAAVLESPGKGIALSEAVVVPSSLRESEDNRIRRLARKLSAHLSGPSAPSEAAADRQAESDPETLALALEGARHYGIYCSACHQANGRGMASLAPPLAGSKWVLGSGELLAKLVLMGKESGSSVMPPWRNVLDDRQLASILTYIRREWGNSASGVKAATVARARQETSTSSAAWTEESLLREIGR